MSRIFDVCGVIMKKAKNETEARAIQERYAGKPHGWVQWKGTDVCMDIHCKCGYHSHVDASFAYNVKCPQCGTMYACNPYIELVEITEVPELLITPELED